MKANERECRLGEEPFVGVGRGTGMTIRELKRRLREFEERHRVRKGSWRERFLEVRQREAK